jgi:hypothetical protein
MRKAYIIGVLLIIVLLVFGACGPASEPEPTPEPPEESLTAPKLLSPHNGATGIELSPILLWEPTPEAGGYELRVSRNSDFSNTVIEGFLPDTSYELVQDLAPLTRYYWMVCAKLDTADPNTPTACSEVWTFTTAAQPASEPEPTPELPPLPEPSPPSLEPIEVTAAQLSTEYDEVGLVAETQYKYQLLEVSGTFDSFDFSFGAPYIDFEVAPDAWEVRAFLADDEETTARTLSKGDEIIVIGECQGTGSYLRIVLANCRIIVP